MTSSKSSRSCDSCDKCDALYCAVLEKHDMCLDALLRRWEPSDYAYCNHQSHSIEYGTPLIMASEHGYLDCAKMLLAAGADVNEYARKKGMALEWAAIKGQYNCMKLLIKSGADVNIRNKYKATALDYALKEGHVKCVKLLIESRADVSDISTVHAVEQGSNKCVEALIKNGADVNHKDRIGLERTALMYAAERGNDHCVALLTGAGAHVNVQDHNGMTALLKAARVSYYSRGSYYKCAKHLIRAGADVNIADNNKFTALYEVCNSGRNVLDNVEMLLTTGADVNMKTARGDNIISTYCKESHRNREEMINVLRLLLSAGGTINNVTRDIRNDISLDTDIFLMNICKERIRTHLLENGYSNLFVSVPKLGLPTLLQNFLLNNISLEDNDEKSSQIGRCNSQ